MTGGVLDVDRSKVLAYRIAAQELDGVEAAPSKLAVLDLGVQDTPHGSARLALSARTSRSVDDPSLRLVWSTRGAPHLHRSDDLPTLVARLWPFNDDDAAGRIASTQIKDGARLGLAAFSQTAQAFRKAVRRPTAKGEVSTAVSAAIDPALTYDCAPCGARHISGALFQQAGLAGGVGLQLDGPVTMLGPLAEPVRTPKASAGVETLILAYLRLLGPATPAEVAKFLGTTQTQLRPHWPADLIEVRVDGRRAWLPAEQVDALRAVKPSRLVRLIPPADPFLQARDRTLVVPDKARQSAVWRILGNPGAVLVDGEVAGTWRSRMAGRARLAITVTSFESVPARVRSRVEEEAGRVAAARGADNTEVTYES